MKNQKVLDNLANIKKNVLLAKNKNVELNEKEQKVNIIAVSKRQPIERINTLLETGHKIFGENQVQESIHKWISLKKKFDNIELHLVGPLQSNKVKDAMQIFDCIQTVDREKIAKILKSEEEKLNKQISYMIQINTGEEKQKSGIMPDDADDFFKYCVNDLKLNIKGLMCIPPFNQDPTIHFGYLKKKQQQYDLSYLSMGMSNDYEKAIRMGATHIRVGTCIFGERLEKASK